MVSSDEKRRLMADYGEPARPRVIIVKAVAGLLIVAVIAAIGVSYPQRDETRLAGESTKSGSAKSTGESVSGKQAATGR